ncbi:MAG: hypothetical protein C0594_13285 [Marinilabiliales bacterium]|nr:MAG: hypothetical protein C0594_13285 [Marinilabiliales bacterium]
MKVLQQLEKVHINFNEDTNAIELIWQKPQDPESYKQAFIMGHDYLVEHKATNWLSDIRLQGVVGPASSKWLQEEMIPKAVANGLRRIAVIMDQDAFKKFYINNIKKEADSNKIQLRYFDSTEEANMWLKS